MTNNWQPIETAPKHEEVLFYRDDCGVFYGEYTYCVEWYFEDELEELEMTEDALWEMFYWCYLARGAVALDRDEPPTHWKPLDAPPTQESITTERKNDD